ncbi:haloacid dehalogenase-like hydrolase [Micromonospora sp. NPDC048898]|uniref:haloacid dehalogenase-like hydrolase n=1 Tax=Micromonospora sp. NPDC048898 TaxID=3364260 RepID=UPI00371EC8A7
MHGRGFIQTVLTGNLRSAAEVKLDVAGLDEFLDLRVGRFGSDARDRFQLPAVVAQRSSAVYGDPLDSARAIVIGDAPNDIACARHADFRVAVVAHRIGRQELASYEPDVVLGSLDPTAVVAAASSLLNAGGSPATC